MKKQMIALFMATIMFVMGGYMTKVNVYAEGMDVEIDISELFTEEAIVDCADLMARGIFLAEGVSVINDSGAGKIGWGGITNAAIRCQVSVNAIVEKKVNGSWVRETSATTTNTNALTATVSKTRSVDSGYWYRVRCTHHASTDSSNSCTDALWM